MSEINKTGIYKIINKINNHIYIGSAAVSFALRWAAHKSLLTRNTHENIHLQNAWNKYGADNFEFKIILLCDPENCLYYEQLLLDKYWDNCINCYNMCPTAGNCTGKKASEETKRKMSENAKKRPPNNKGKPRSQRAKDRAKQTMAGRDNPFANKTHDDDMRDYLSVLVKEREVSPETIKKRATATKLWWANRETAKILDINKAADIMHMITENASLKQIAIKLGISNGTITNIRIGRAWKKAIELLESPIKEKFIEIQNKAIARRNK